MTTLKFKITNLTCSACVKLSTMALEDIGGVTQAMVDLATGQVELIAEREIAWDEITNALKGVGKNAVIPD